MMTLRIRPLALSKLFLGAAVALAAGVCAPRVVSAAVSAGPSAQTAAQVQDGNPYEVKTEVVGECKVGMECVAHIRIEAHGEYHVNESFPFKFTAAADKAELHGAKGNVFSDGDFERQGQTVGVMTVRFKPTAKGPMNIGGKFKICVCTPKICAPETIDVSIPVTVK